MPELDDGIGARVGFSGSSTGGFESAAPMSCSSDSLGKLISSFATAGP